MTIFLISHVCEAILQLFDFEWLNHTYFFNLLKRTASYFDGLATCWRWPFSRMPRNENY